MSGERVQVEAWTVAITAQLGPHAAYDSDDVPEPEPDMYVLVRLSRRFAGVAWMAGGRAMRGWRLTTHLVGTTPDEVRWLSERVGRLEDKRLAAIGSTPLRFEVAAEIDDNEDRFEQAVTWTYAAPV